MNLFTRIATIALGLALAGSLFACLPSEETAAQSEAQAANREYMSQLNLFASETNEVLTGFSDAVKTGDATAMREAVEEEKALIETLEELEAPEALADVAEQYIAGAKDLQEALEDMVALYEKAEDEGGAYLESPEGKKALEEAQKLYDAGLDAMEAADEAAAGKE